MNLIEIELIPLCALKYVDTQLSQLCVGPYIFLGDISQLTTALLNSGFSSV